MPDIKAIPNPLEGYDKDSTVIIKPTCESNDSSQQKLHKFIDQYKSWFCPKAKIFSDEQALKLDLSKYDIIVFGGPQGNLFLKKFIDGIPLIIDKDKVIANRVFKGDDYQLMTGWINPFNKKRKMTIYTAQDVEKVININQIPHGASNYVLGKNYKTHKAGNYRRVMKIWTCE